MALKIILAHIEVYSRQCVFQAHERVFESVCLWNIDPLQGQRSQGTPGIPSTYPLSWSRVAFPCLSNE